MRNTHAINIFSISVRSQSSSNTSPGSILLSFENFFEAFSLWQHQHFLSTIVINENLSLHVGQSECLNLSTFLQNFFRRFHSTSLRMPIECGLAYDSIPPAPPH